MTKLSRIEMERFEIFWSRDTKRAVLKQIRKLTADLLCSLKERRINNPTLWKRRAILEETFRGIVADTIYPQEGCSGMTREREQETLL